MQEPAISFMLRRKLDFRTGSLGKKENDDFKILLAFPLIYVFISNLKILLQPQGAGRNPRFFGHFSESGLVTLLTPFQLAFGEIPIAPSMIQEQVFGLYLAIAIFFSFINNNPSRYFSWHKIKQKGRCPT